MRRLFFALSFLIFAFAEGIAQSPSPFQLSEKAQISILTCGPSAELYSQFGHSAFRVKDPLYGIDVVYNYGTFDFNTPNFYTKFARGKLLYQLSRSKFDRFLYTYKYENRWVKQQTLSLEPKAKQELFVFLENNLKPENRSYKYDFFFDNCATKMRTIVEEVMNERVTFNDDVPTSMTFRETLHQYTKPNNWGGFGIDIALGSVIDKEITAKELFYLPDYVFDGYANASINRSNGSNIPLVADTVTILEASDASTSPPFLGSPLMVFGILLIITLLVTYRDHKKRKRSVWLDTALFLTTGFAGCVILFLWFGTDHTATALNFNLLWAFAPNLAIVFLLKNQKKWATLYLGFLIILLAFVPIIWIIGFQVFPIMLIPILLTLAIRYGYLGLFFKRSSSTSEEKNGA